jgi:hypothetical protein
VSPSPQDRAASIAAQLAGLGLALPGTLMQRRVRCGWAGCRCHAEPPQLHGPYWHCGWAGCRCHAEPPQLHGPYWHWTRKRAGKTISRLVPTTRSPITGSGWTTTTACASWSLSWKTSPSPSPTSAAATRPAPAEPGKQAHNPVDAARLSRGRHHQKIAFPQVRPNCEGLSQVVAIFRA